MASFAHPIDGTMASDTTLSMLNVCHVVEDAMVLFNLVCCPKRSWCQIKFILFLVLPKQLPLSIQSGNLSMGSHRIATTGPAVVHALFSVHYALEASRWTPHYVLGDYHPLACVTPLASL